ncbi:MAG: proprotein convertase P-domain-containing protein [Candidatus Caldarchaeum sp.]
MKHSISIAVFTGLLATNALSAIFHIDAGGRVPAEANQTRSTNPATFNFTVAGMLPIIVDVNLHLDMVHSWDEDLEIRLISPGGTNVLLFNQLPGGPPRFDDFDDTTFDQQAANPITAGTAPYTGAYRPQGNLNDFNGQNPNGVWRLWIFDHRLGDYGWVYRAGDPQFETRRGPLSGTRLEIVAVPEPLSWMVLAGSLGWFVLRRRR